MKEKEKDDDCEFENIFQLTKSNELIRLLFIGTLVLLLTEENDTSIPWKDRPI